MVRIVYIGVRPGSLNNLGQYMRICLSCPVCAIFYLTRSAIGVTHFRYFVSQRLDSLTPSCLNVNLDSEKNRFVDLGHGIIRTMHFDFC